MYYNSINISVFKPVIYFKLLMNHFRIDKGIYFNNFGILIYQITL